MKAWITLADAAQIEGGKLFIMGGGIYLVGPGPVTMGVALQIITPWEFRGRRIQAKIRLLDARGAPAQIPTPTGVTTPLEINAMFETVPSQGTPPGSTLPISFALNVAALVLPGGDYSWAAYLENSDDYSARARFTVRSAPVQPGI